LKVAAGEFLEEKKQKKLRKKEKGKERNQGSLIDHHAVWVQSLLLALRNFSASGSYSNTWCRSEPLADPAIMSFPDLLFPRLSLLQADDPANAFPRLQGEPSDIPASAVTPSRFLFHVLTRALSSPLTDASRILLLSTIGFSLTQGTHRTPACARACTHPRSH
jgi:hypothetical protein